MVQNQRAVHIFKRHGLGTVKYRHDTPSSIVKLLVDIFSLCLPGLLPMPSYKPVSGRKAPFNVHSHHSVHLSRHWLHTLLGHGAFDPTPTALNPTADIWSRCFAACRPMRVASCLQWLAHRWTRLRRQLRDALSGETELTRVNEPEALAVDRLAPSKV